MLMQMNRNRVGITNVYENHSPSNRAVTLLISIHPETMFLHVILRSLAKSGTTKNLIVSVAAEILRGVYPERLDLSDTT
jgi:pyrroline-5-carboxylate reductase